jgi:hypothetical protein
MVDDYDLATEVVEPIGSVPAFDASAYVADHAVVEPESEPVIEEAEEDDAPVGDNSDDDASVQVSAAVPDAPLPYGVVFH